MITKTGPNQGSRYKIMKFTDLTGACEAAVFTRDLERTNEHLLDNAIVFIEGRVVFRNETPGLRISDVVPLQRARERLTGHVILRLDGGAGDADTVARFRDIAKGHAGPVPVRYEVPADGHAVVVAAPDGRTVAPTDALLADVAAALGEGRLAFAPKPPPPREARPQYARRQ
jgi:DNA polymerase III alpha subunit